MKRSIPTSSPERFSPSLMSESRGRLNFVLALPAEAKPIIHYFELKPENGYSPFKTYRSHDSRLWLVISGVGKDSAVEATTYLATKSKADEQTAWLNVGIGGQRDLPVGTVVLAHSITDASTERSWYPTITFETQCKKVSVRTVERSVNDYPTDDVYEMEAAGFFATASQIPHPGMVHVLKVVSDNHSSQLEQISSTKVSQLIRDCLGIIEQTVSAITSIPTPPKE